MTITLRKKFLRMQPSKSKIGNKSCDIRGDQQPQISTMSQRVQIAVLTSIVLISAFVVLGVYHQHQQKRRNDESKSHEKSTMPDEKQGVKYNEDTTKSRRKEGKTTSAGPKKHLQNATLDTAKDLKEMTKNKEASTKSPIDGVAAAAAAASQEAATEATKKYKAGQYVEAIEMYTIAIQKSESVVPVDSRNLKVMFSNRAAAYERIGDFQQVVNDCTNALSLDNSHSKAYLRRAKAKTVLGDLTGALVDYVCLLVLSEEKRESVDETVAAEITRLHTEMTTNEIEKLQQQQLNPNRFLPDQFFITSYYSSFHKQDDENDVIADASIEEYTNQLQALDDDNDNRQTRGELLTKRGLAHRAMKQYEEASADFEAALAILEAEDKGYYVANVEGGTYYHLRGEFENAQTCFEAALKVKPHSLFAKIRMGGLCFDRKELKQALRWFDKALAEKPNCSTAYFHRGQLHSIDTEGKSIETSMANACKDLERCIELTPDFSMAYIQLGVTHARNGNFEKAVEYLKTATRYTPDVPEIYNYLGETYMQMAQNPGSNVNIQMMEEMFDKAIELDATYPMAYINKGNLLMQKGSEYSQEPLELFEKAVEMCPRSKFAYCHLAQAYMVMQDYTRAIEQIDLAISYAFAVEELNELLAIRVTAVSHLQAKIQLNR